MKSSGEQNFESETMPHVHALFQTALQLTEDRAAAAELVTEVYSHAGKSFARRHRLADWRSALFKILIERARRRSDRTTAGGRAFLSGVGRTEREILLLVDCQSFSYQQAADILGFSRELVAEGITLGRTHLETKNVAVQGIKRPSHGFLPV
jgi:DNA-directed RNA polymerase specialized sigma24 family protein